MLLESRAHHDQALRNSGPIKGAPRTTSREMIIKKGDIPRGQLPIPEARFTLFAFRNMVGEAQSIPLASRSDRPRNHGQSTEARDECPTIQG